MLGAMVVAAGCWQLTVRTLKQRCGFVCRIALYAATPRRQGFHERPEDRCLQAALDFVGALAARVAFMADKAWGTKGGDEK